jgi:uncharacterized protein YqgQ
VSFLLKQPVFSFLDENRCFFIHLYWGKKFAGETMKTVYDVQQLLKRFGTIIYVGDRLADLELMEEELKELYQSQLIDVKDYQMALLILRHEAQIEREKRMKKE